jgi:dihydrofolate reductase
MAISLDGYYAAPDGSLDWAPPSFDDDFSSDAVNEISTIDIMLFGRVTYEGMLAYWPTAAAAEADPALAETMNTTAKIVFSNTLEKAEWDNTTLVTGEAAHAIRELKRQPGGDLAIIGSPRLTASLLDQGLVDELRVGVHPVLLGAGLSLFAGLQKRIPLRLTRTSTLASGNVRLFYKPVERSG